MKKLFSLLCALMLLIGIVPASAGVHDLDHLFSQVLSLRELMLDKRVLLPMLIGSNSALDQANEILNALEQPVKTVQVLRFETEGSLKRLEQLIGEEFPEMSDVLYASYERSVPTILINQMNSAYGTLVVVANSALSTSASAVVPGMTEDALVLLDFGADWQLICTFVTGEDEIVHAMTSVVSAQSQMLADFCELYGLAEADVKAYAGDELYRAGATEALRDDTHQMTGVLKKLAETQNPDGISPETMAYFQQIVNYMSPVAACVRMRMLPLDTMQDDTLLAHAQLSNLVKRYHQYFGTALACVADFFTASAAFDMPRGMADHAIVQADYEVRMNDRMYPAFSVVCVYTLVDNKVLCTAAYARYDREMSFLDQMLAEGWIDAEPAQIEELKP